MTIRVDPITQQVVSAGLTGIVLEMQNSLFRTGFSTIIRESQDASCAILDRDGRLVAQHVVLALHMGAFPACAGALLAAYPPETMQPGDAFVLNHPYEGGSPHAPDVCIITPVFVDGQLVAMCANMAHKTDIGGTVPGSCSGQAKETYHEGLHLPAVRYAVGGVVSREVEAIIAANSRSPELVCGDLRGQMGACRLGEQRLQELMHRYGIETVLAAAERNLELSAEMVRDELARWPDGTVEAEALIDDDGIDLGQPVRVHVRVTKSGRKIEFDFSGSAGQTRGPANIRPPLVRAVCSFALACMVQPVPPVNQGLISVPELVLREGSLLNPTWPAPVNGYNQTAHALVEAVLTALGQFVPQRLVAPSCASRSIVLSGFNPTTGRNYVQYEIFGGGSGARAEKDGVSGTSVNHSNARIASVEIVESEFPVRCRQFRFLPDSGGAGRFRGGVGFVREYELLAPEARFSVRSGKQLIPPAGLAGGHPGRAGACTINPGTAAERRLPSRYADLRLVQGDVIRLETPGGGGVGDPATRDPDRIAADLTEGAVTAEAAAQIYGYRQTGG